MKKLAHICGADGDFGVRDDRRFTGQEVATTVLDENQDGKVDATEWSLFGLGIIAALTGPF